MKIESVQNAKVKEWNKLKEKKYRDQTSRFIIEGDHLLKEALKYHQVIEIIALTEEFKTEDLPFYEVSEEVMKKLSSYQSIPKVIAICKKNQEKEITGTVCLLDDIQDPGNLGTIIRSAVAFQIDTLILSEKTVDTYNEKVVSASEGMLFHLNILRGNIQNYCIQLQKQNYCIYGTNVQHGQNLKHIDFLKKSAIIIGNEGKGMNEYLQRYCDKLIYIPMESHCESLNAGVCASIIFYEMHQKVW
jgi:TrmH family RNA methyltransferase